jgi:hypothetical protein
MYACRRAEEESLAVIGGGGIFPRPLVGARVGRDRKAIAKIYEKRGTSQNEAAEHGKRARAKMEIAFEDAMVVGYDHLLPLATNLPDPDDAHVLAAAAQIQAAIIVTENLKDFPSNVLDPLNIEAKSTDAFIADTIALDPGRAVAAIRRMRERFKSRKNSGSAAVEHGSRWFD